MCGIAGVINWGDLAALTRMTEIQRHRGPDDGGVWQSHLPDGTWIGLGSRRLAILDLSSAGHMPMSTPDDRLTIVYNGEVYNYPELRHRIEASGIHLRSRSDTEAVLYLYQLMGPDCVKHLNGMFAFAIWDADREQLFFARDHVGVKPFYYVEREGRFAFASEVKALLELPGLTPQLSRAALDQYLTFLWVPDPLTMFEGIWKLPAGHYGIFRRGRLRLTQYWDLELPDRGHHYSRSRAQLSEDLRERFQEVVQRQMISDVPLGAFLSAGLDSSSVVATMSRVSTQPVRTFTIAVPSRHRHGSNTVDDVEVARRTARRFGCVHTEIEANADVASLLPRLVYQMDEPISDPAAIMCYLVTREARKDITVLLAGNGGDELFAGYRKYRAHYLARHYRMIPKLLRRLVIEPAVAALPTFHGRRYSQYVNFAKKMVRSASLPARERFIQHGVYLTEEDKRQLYSLSFRDAALDGDPRDRHLEYFRNVQHADFLNQMLYVDTKTFLVSLNLTYNDKMSMANSVEVRVPFLDAQFMQWAMSNIPPWFKLRGGSTKDILRRAMADELPPEVLRQPKAGFGAPVEFWLPEQLREMVDDLLGEENVKRRALFSPDAVRQMVSEQRTGRRNWAYQIWQLLTLELWMQSFVDSPRPLAEAAV